MGKTMAVGIYADRTILAHVPDHPPPVGVPALAKLHMMLTIQGLPPGEHDAQAQILYPDGSVAPRISPVKVSVMPGRSANLVFGFSRPFRSRRKADTSSRCKWRARRSNTTSRSVASN